MTVCPPVRPLMRGEGGRQVLLAFDLADAVLGTALTITMAASVGVAPVVNARVARRPTKPVLVGADAVRTAIAAAAARAAFSSWPAAPPREDAVDQNGSREHHA